MSYNCDTVKYKERSAWMRASDIVRLHKEHKGDLPEMNFLEDHLSLATAAFADGEHERRIELLNFYWAGVWSGNSYDLLKDEIMPFVHADRPTVVRFIWEAGDSETRLTIGKKDAPRKKREGAGKDSQESRQLGRQGER